MKEIWAAVLSQLVYKKQLDFRRARGLLERRSEEISIFLRRAGIDVNSFASQIKRLKKKGIELIPIFSPTYPSSLKRLSSAPLVLFKMGRYDLKRPSVAIVGTRFPSLRSAQIARKLAGLFCEAGFMVVSGLALGVDGEAHKGAIEAGGGTIAVLGCDLERIYPPQHKRLAQAVIARGALITEHLRADPTPENLIARNRLIAGLAEILIAVEPRKGAMNAVRSALAQGKPVFVLQCFRSQRALLRREEGFYLLDPARFEINSLFGIILQKARVKVDGSLQKVRSLVNFKKTW